MMQRKEKIRFGDRVRIKSGFYENEKAILTYLCPESGCFCGYIEGDGTDSLHYFYGEELEVIGHGFYFSGDDEEDGYEEPDQVSSKPNLVSLGSHKKGEFRTK